MHIWWYLGTQIPLKLHELHQFNNEAIIKKLQQKLKKWEKMNSWTEKTDRDAQSNESRYNNVLRYKRD